MTSGDSKEKELSAAEVQKGNEDPAPETSDAAATDKSPEQRLRQIGHRYFEHTAGSVTSSLMHVRKIIEKSDALRLKKVDQLNDYAVPVRDFPLLLLCDKEMLERYESWLKNESETSVSLINIYYKARDYYLSWCNALTVSDKKKYSSLLSELCDGGISSRLFMAEIFRVLILLGLKEFRPFALASGYLLNIVRHVESLRLGEDFLGRINYLLSNISGYISLLQEDYSYAVSRFSQAMKDSHRSITGRYYCCLSAMHLGDKETAIKNARDILFFDVDCLRYAIDNSDIRLFGLFLRNPEILNLFSEDEFAAMSAELEGLFAGFWYKHDNYASSLKNAVAKLRTLGLEEFYTPEILRKFTFLDKIFTEFSDCDSLLFRMSLKILRDNYNQVVNFLMKSVRSDFSDVIRSRLDQYDEKIMHIGNSIEQLQEYYNAAEESAKIEVDNEIQAAEIRIKKDMAGYYEELKNIDKDPRYDSMHSFKNGMLYDVVISAIVIILISFSRLSYLSGLSPTLKSSGHIENPFFTGLKWGGISFLIGWILAVGIAVSVVLRKSNASRILRNKLTNQANIREQEFRRIREAKSNQLKMLEERVKQKITRYKERQAALAEARKKEEVRLNDDAEDQIAHYQEVLQSMIQ